MGIEDKIYEMNNQIGVDVVFRLIRRKKMRHETCSTICFPFAGIRHGFRVMVNSNKLEENENRKRIIHAIKDCLRTLVVKREDLLDSQGAEKSASALDSMVKERKEKVINELTMLTSTNFAKDEKSYYGQILNDYKTIMSTRQKAREIVEKCQHIKVR